MNYLVTGGAGFIGSYMCERLVEMEEVMCLDNFDPYYSSQIKRKNIEPLMQHPHFKPIVEGYWSDAVTFESLLRVGEGQGKYHNTEIKKVIK